MRPRPNGQPGSMGGANLDFVAGDQSSCILLMQVPCTPPGDVIVRVNAAGGSYIRLVLLDVCTTSLSLSFLTCCVCCYLAFSVDTICLLFHPCTAACDTLMRMQNPAVLLCCSISQNGVATQQLLGSLHSSLHLTMFFAGCWHDRREERGDPRKGADRLGQAGPCVGRELADQRCRHLSLGPAPDAQ